MRTELQRNMTAMARISMVFNNLFLFLCLLRVIPLLTFLVEIDVQKPSVWSVLGALRCILS